jgi:uncharacterized repeat protein (TIGR01451 family)
VEYEIVVKNTGNVPLSFSSFSDPHCEGITGGPGASAVGPGEATTYTCTHSPLSVGTWTNTASVEGSEGTGSETSNEVIVIVPREPSFTIKKLQRIAGEPSFTTSELTGTTAETVEYEIIVTNTGNVPLSFSSFSDPHCEGITGGPGASAVAPGEATTYTCSHGPLSVGRWTTTASVTGSEGTGPKTSNEVIVNVPGEQPMPAFTIEKLQKIAGEPSVTKSELTGTIGQTVEYEIVVTNTGNVPLTFSDFSDLHCEGIAGGPGASALAPGAATIYTCSHALASVGTWTNTASVEGSEGTGVETSNEVIVNVKERPAPAFTIEKLQKIAGELSFTKSELTGTIGQTVEYEIVVTNTGNVPLSFSSFSDPHCEGITGGPGTSALAPGEATTYTCSHTLTSTGPYTNEASVEGSDGTRQTSNEVIVNSKEPAVVPPPGPAPTSSPPVEKGGVLAICELSEPEIVLHGASGPKRRTFTVQISSPGIKQITFYLDGRKLKTLKQSQAKDGKFTIKINPSKLSYGAHKVSVKTLMSNSICEPIARTSVFVHPHSQRVSPSFTG